MVAAEGATRPRAVLALVCGSAAVQRCIGNDRPPFRKPTPALVFRSVSDTGDFAARRPVENGGRSVTKPATKFAFGLKPIVPCVTMLAAATLVEFIGAPRDILLLRVG